LSSDKIKEMIFNFQADDDNDEDDGFDLMENNIDDFDDENVHSIINRDHNRDLHYHDHQFLYHQSVVEKYHDLYKTNNDKVHHLRQWKPPSQRLLRLLALKCFRNTGNHNNNNNFLLDLSYILSAVAQMESCRKYFVYDLLRHLGIIIKTSSSSSSSSSVSLDIKDDEDEDDLNFLYEQINNFSNSQQLQQESYQCMR
jgi:hypothetical protein